MECASIEPGLHSDAAAADLMNDRFVLLNCAVLGSMPTGSPIEETTAVVSALAAPSGTRRATSSWPIFAGVVDSDRFILLISADESSAILPYE